MANVKITELPQVSTILGTDIVPTVASSATSKITITDFANSLPQVSSSLSASYLSGSSAIVTDLTSSLDASINSITVGRGGGNIANNTTVGDRAFGNNSSGIQNTAIGSFALSSSIAGAGNTAVGYISLRSNTSSNNTAVGWSSMRDNTIGSNNVGIGTSALISNTSGSNNVAMGLQALLGSTTGNGNTAIGYRAGYGTGVNNNTTGGNNIFLGNISVGVTGSDSNRTWIGNTSTTSTWLGGSLLLGQTSDFGNRLQVTGNGSITGSLIVSQGITGSLFGTSSWAENALTASFVLNAISASYVSGSSAIVDNLTSSQDILIRSNTSEPITIGRAYYSASNGNNLAFGHRALRSGSAGTNRNIAIGDYTLNTLQSGIENVAIGYAALYYAINNRNTAVGSYALFYTTGSTGFRNNAFGAYALAFNTTGEVNNAFGSYALYRNVVGSYNAAFGDFGLYNLSTGSSNVAVGQAAVPNLTSGEGNVFIGRGAAPSLLSGSNNTIIGGITPNADINTPIFGLLTGSYNTIIGSNVKYLPTTLNSNIILADGQGSIRAWHNSESWSFSGSVVANQGFTGSLFGTASYATNIYNLDGDLTSNRTIGSGSGYKLTLNPELIFNAPISGINSKYYIDNQINLATGTSLGTRATSSISSSMITFADAVNSNGSQTYYSAFNNINLSAAVGSTASTLYGNTIQANIAGNETSSRITAVGSSIRVARYGFSGSNDFSENINNQIYGSIISVNQYGGVNSNPNCYTGTITGLLLAGSVSTGRVGNYYGIDIRPLFTPNNSTTSSAITNYYGIRLQATLGSIVPTSSIDNYYAVHIDNPTVRTNSIISNLYGLYAPSSTMKHHVSGTLSIGTVETGSYQLQVLGNTGISGSLVVTGSIISTQGFTGSLFGTSSWATNAISSSYPIAVTGSTLYSTNPSAGNNFNTTQNIFLGEGSGQDSQYTTFAVSLGYQAGYQSNFSESYTDNLGDFTASVNFIGYQAGYQQSGSRDANFIGFRAGYQTEFSNGANFIGDSAGYLSKNGDNTNFIGRNAGFVSDGVRYSNAIGRNAAEGSLNVIDSNIIGESAGENSKNIRDSNFIGPSAGTQASFCTGSNFIGYYTGFDATSSYSTLIGWNAGSNTFSRDKSIGSNNIIIGTNITLEKDRKDSINLGGIIFGTGSYFPSSVPIEDDVYSGSVNGRIGINQPNPQFSFDVSGSGRFTNNLIVTGSVQISTVLTLPPRNPLPSGIPTGSIAVSGSGVDCKPYFWNGNTWTSLI